MPDPSKDRHHQHSMVLVPIDTQGVSIERMLPVFGDYDAPHGQAVNFDNVRVLSVTLSAVQTRL